MRRRGAEKRSAVAKKRERGQPHHSKLSRVLPESLTGKIILLLDLVVENWSGLNERHVREKQRR